ncbi:MAG: SurA N-terminal domain-containing protein [Hyphomonadaceae bacterium]|nr:SurA N-terminal domain-containing protein [Hyphomonadaceae bacterium]
MLRQLRSFTRGWIANVLLVLLIAAFAAWGINDVFSGVGAQQVARVGKEVITPTQLTRTVDLTLRSMRAQGQNLTQAEAVERGLHLQALENMIGQAAVTNYSRSLGVSASDAQVAESIRRIPAVLNPLTNMFDQSAYTQFLNEYRYSQQEFETEVRNEMTLAMMRHALAIGTRAPSSYGKLALAFESETRTISVGEIPASAAGAIPAPTNAQVQDFYEENREALQVPEFRALTLVYARISDFTSRVDISEQQLREEFEARRASFATPERRTYVRIAAQNEQQAQEAATRLGRGEQPNAVAQALGLQMTRSENESREQIADDAVADAVFSLQAGQARAVRATLSPFAVVRVDQITPATTPDFAAARDQIRQELATDEAGELLNTAIGAFEDARASGAPAAEAARNAGLTVVQIPAAMSEGLDREGQPIAELAGQESLLQTAFETPEGEASDFFPVDNADVLVAVDAITPASTRPLEEVREQLVAAWSARERARRLQELADNVATAVTGGQAFAAALRANQGAVAVTSRPIDRRSAAQLPARRLGAQIFAAPVGGVVSDARADGGAMVVAIVESVQRADPTEQPQLVEAARQQVSEGLAAGLFDAIVSDLVSQARPRRNQELIGQLFNSGPTEEQ